MSVFYPREIRQAAKAAAKSQELEPQINRAQTTDKLQQIMPASLNIPKTAEVIGLGQFHNKIGIYIDYPEFEQERAMLLSGVNELLGIEYGWGEVTPHISIGRLFLDRQSDEYRKITNLAEIESSLPETIQLSPAQPLKD